MSNLRTGDELHGLHPEDIRAEIKKRDKSPTALAEENGYDRTAVARALSRPWPAVEQIIADFLGTTPSTLWPDRYGKDGLPLTKRSGWTKSSKRRPRRNVQSGTAA